MNARSLPDVLFDSDWSWLRTVQKRVETDGAAATVVFDLAVLSSGELATLRWLLRWKATTTGLKRVSLERLERELSERVTEGIGLRDTLTMLKGEPLHDRRAELRAARTGKATKANLTYTELLSETSGIPDLDHERQALLTTPPDPALRVPAESRCHTTSWPVYEAALRAAVIWWRKTAAGERLAAKELAGKAWRDTKRWTTPRQIAFQQLIGCSFDKAVDTADTEICLRGPLIWETKSALADAFTCRPWISLPARGIQTLGEIRCSAVGVLLVENHEAFEKVCELPDIADKWLCIWGSGYLSKGLVRLLRDLNRPIAAWGDLDADGLHIIANAAERVGKPVHTVGMNLELWQNGVWRKQTPEQIARGRALAANMHATCPSSQRELARLIAETGQGCEQETLYAEVLPTLATELSKILRICGGAQQISSGKNSHGIVV